MGAARFEPSDLSREATRRSQVSNVRNLIPKRNSSLSGPRELTAVDRSGLRTIIRDSGREIPFLPRNNPY
jgi:hypothetical protein